MLVQHAHIHSTSLQHGLLQAAASTARLDLGDVAASISFSSAHPVRRPGPSVATRKAQEHEQSLDERCLHEKLHVPTVSEAHCRTL